LFDNCNLLKGQHLRSKTANLDSVEYKYITLHCRLCTPSVCCTPSMAAKKP